MSHARPEYAIVVALIGVLLAIGIPAFKRGQPITAGICMVLAVAVAGWAVLAIWRSRG